MMARSVTMAGMSAGSGSLKTSVFVRDRIFLGWPEMDTLALGPRRGPMDLFEEQLSYSKTTASSACRQSPTTPTSGRTGRAGSPPLRATRSALGPIDGACGLAG